MSADPQYDRIVTLEPRPDGVPPVPVLEPPPVVADRPVAAPRKPRSPWLIPAIVAAVGLFAAGVLGYLLNSTSTQLNTTRHTLATTQATLTTTQQQLATSQDMAVSLVADAAANKVTADYVQLYIVDSGKVQTDYAQFQACDNYSSCRTAAQQGLTDMQSFQSDRKSATVPAALSSSDAALGDGLSAGIAALNELISGMDNSDKSKIMDGFSKLDSAMLSIAKAESALGTAVG
jgi:hypothetical protein